MTATIVGALDSADTTGAGVQDLSDNFRNTLAQIKLFCRDDCDVAGEHNNMLLRKRLKCLLPNNLTGLEGYGQRANM